MYLGLYAGVQSTPQGLQEQVESSDLVLDLGGFQNVHMNTAFWTSHLPEQAHIQVHATWVQIGAQIFVDVAMADLLDRLNALTQDWRAPAMLALAYPPMPMVGEPADPNSSEGFFPRLQRHLQPNDLLLVESSGCALVMAAMRLPAGVGYESQLIWSSIGFATPLAIGVAMAEADRRVVLVSGDGAHQETMGAIATMGFHDVKPIIFLLNNGCYGCEYKLDTGRHHYNEIPPVSYSQLPEVLGCKDWLCRKVATIAELDEAMAAIKAQPNRAAYIEVMIPAEENVSFPDKLLDYMYKLKTPTGL